ncbi:MAG: ribosome small subunit-dependent GTPase A [Chlorobiota bacterium]
MAARWDEHSRGRHRTAIKPVKHKPLSHPPQQGRVMEGTGRWWLVEPAQAPETLVECSIAGTVVVHHGDSTLVAVGDLVEFILTDKQAPSGLPQGMIVSIHDRRTKLTRYRRREGQEQVITSNVDQLVILHAAAEPRYDRFLIDRYLIAAQRGELTPILCINKLDLGSLEQLSEELRYYSEQLGLQLILCSARTGAGIDCLREALRDKVSVFSGPSGAGKSTLTNLLLGREEQLVGKISHKLQRGRHVTTMARMFRLPQGGYIVDTPGIQDLTIWELTRDELPAYFDDFLPWAQECTYQPCSHIHEPQCAVRAAVERGEIPAWRYEHYCRLWQSLPKYEWRRGRR